MFVTLLITEERQDALVQCLPAGSRTAGIDLSDEPEKDVFLNRFAGMGHAAWRALANATHR